MREAIGIFGPLNMGGAISSLREGLKYTAEYLGKPTEEGAKHLGCEVIAPHGSKARFELALNRTHPIMGVPFGENGPRWDQIRTIRARRFRRLALSRHIFLPPISYTDPSLNVPPALQTSAFMELLTADESLQPNLPPRELPPGAFMIVTPLGEAALEDIRVGFGENEMTPFNAARCRERLALRAARAVLAEGERMTQPIAPILEPVPVVE